MDLENIKLSEVKQIRYHFSYVWNLKIKQTNKKKQNKTQTHSYREQIAGCQRGGKLGLDG